MNIISLLLAAMTKMINYRRRGYHNAFSFCSLFNDAVSSSDYVAIELLDDDEK
jgi:hypothetical protein